MSCLVRRWTTPRIAVMAVMLLAADPFARGPLRASIDLEGACPEPGLSLYASRPYATEKGARRRCGLLQQLQQDGAPITPPLRAKVFRELANRYAIQLDFEGAVGLPRQTVDYLMKNMPEAAALVSAYSGNEYMATQVDGTPGPDRFFVTNNDTFAAGFTYLRSHNSPDASEHMFFETGRAKVLFWRIWGSSIVDYELREGEEGSSLYDIEVHVFTDSRVLRVVLNSGLFRYFARSMFEGILSDIESAVKAFTADADPSDRLPPYFVAGLKRSLQDPAAMASPDPRPGEGPWSTPSAL